MTLQVHEIDGQKAYGLYLEDGELSRMLRVSLKVLGEISDFAKHMEERMKETHGLKEGYAEHIVRAASTLILAEMIRQVPGYGFEVVEKEKAWIEGMDADYFWKYAPTHVMKALNYGDFSGVNEGEIERVLLAIMLMNPDLIIDCVSMELDSEDIDDEMSRPTVQERGFSAN